MFNKKNNVILKRLKNWLANSARSFLFGAILIVLSAALLRLPLLATIPPQLNRDEAALAYNAFLLSHGGKDEWGNSQSVQFRSFGDYKLPGYIWLIQGIALVGGWNDAVVRLPSAGAGIVLVILMGIFVRRYLKWSRPTTLFAMWSTATAPVFIFFSRMAFEANVGLALLVGSVLCALRSIEIKSDNLYVGKSGVAPRPFWIFWLISSAILALAAVFTYNTPLFLLPGLVSFLFVIGLRWQRYRRIAWVLVTLGVVFGVGFWQLSATAAQKGAITIFADETTWDQWRLFRDALPHPLLQRTLGARPVYWLAVILKNFLASLGPDFLVWRGGGHPWHSVPGTGHLMMSTYLLGVFGLFWICWQWVALLWRIVRQRQIAAGFWRLGEVFPFLFLLSIWSLAPAAVTVDAPHATRSLLFLWLWVVFAAATVELGLTSLVGRKYRWLCLGLLSGLALWAGGASVWRYFTQMPHFDGGTRPGLAAILRQERLTRPDSLISPNGSTTTHKIGIIDPAGFLYISVAWYLQMEPAIFYRSLRRQLPNNAGLYYGEEVGEYHMFAHEPDVCGKVERIIVWDLDKASWQVKGVGCE